jgi:hypothetical protein
MCGVEPYFEKFVKLIKPFLALWNSARVTCIAVGAPYERRSLATRIVLREEELAKGQSYRKVMWLEPTPQFLVAVVDFPKAAAWQILCSATDKHKVDLENGSTVDRVLLRWSLPGNSSADTHPPRLSGLSWQDPFRYEKPWSRNQLGENRTCLALTGTGDFIRDIMSDEFGRRVGSKLRLDPPYFDGIEGLYETLLPGLRHGASDPRVVQVVFPLPLDMEQTEDGSIALRTLKGALEERMQIILNFGPVGPATAIQVTQDGAKLTADGRTSGWRWEIPWPHRAESGKASLYYADEEVSCVNLRRWPGAGTLRAAVDCYFDPDHKLLQGALFGKNEKESKVGKAQDAFEMAVIRLMNLLGIPLVWYGQGASPRRSDAAGLVHKEERHVVVLAECTLEKPEAKFSALKGRTEELAESLKGEAEVLPAVFSQADPPGSVFDAAHDHGIALVGRNELSSLFEMLSATTRKEDALSFLNRMRSRVGGLYRRLDGT